MANSEAISFVAEHPDESREFIYRVLCNSLRNESVAQGTARRVAFRVTRHLLGGAVALGLGVSEISQGIGVRRESLRTRSNTDGILPASAFATVAEVSPAELDAWSKAGRLEISGPDAGGTVGYLASSLLAVYIQHQLDAEV